MKQMIYDLANHRTSLSFRERIENDLREIVCLNDEDASELMLVRHAETQTCAVQRDEFDRGARLSRNGVDQARRLADRLRSLWVEQIYFAPEQPTEETASILSDIIRRPAACVPELRDIAFYGPCDADEVPAYADAANVRRFVANPRWDALQGFERTRSFRLRVVLGLEAIITRHPGRRVVVVTHGSLINAYLSMVLDIPRDYFFEPDYASISTVRAHRELYAVRAINDTAHLLGL